MNNVIIAMKDFKFDDINDDESVEDLQEFKCSMLDIFNNVESSHADYLLAAEALFIINAALRKKGINVEYH